MGERIMLGIVIGALVVVLGSAVLLKYWVLTPSLPADLNNESLKAVFLDNGQVYFGELESLNKDFLRMNSPYYLQTRTVLQEPVEAGKEPEQRRQLSLAALGGPGLQIHGPEREMYIPWESVQYIENLRDDSEVVKLIAEEEKKQEEDNEGEKSSDKGATEESPKGEENK